jgi:Tfp pilus assembly protein PilO
MISEHRKQRAVRQLQALEQKARHLQRLLDEGELGKQLSVLAELFNHLHDVRQALLREAIELGLLRSTRTDEVSDIADELIEWLERLKLT